MNNRMVKPMAHHSVVHLISFLPGQDKNNLKSFLLAAFMRFGKDCLDACLANLLQQFFG